MPRPCLFVLSLLPSLAFAAPARQPAQPTADSRLMKLRGIDHWVTVQPDN